MVYFQVVIYERKMFIRLATGLVVMGGDSCSHTFGLRIVMFVRKDENKRKRGRGWPIF